MRSNFIKKITLFLLLCTATALIACAETSPNKNNSSKVSESKESVEESGSMDDVWQDSLSSDGEDSSVEEDSSAEGNSSMEEIVPPSGEASSSEEESGETSVEFPDVIIP